ncbi:hypothetical protein [Paraliobacillus sp. JSM ZJ581]|uniref:hypothetical protein n=1 Tax=Paraliobacillus sp. JSM ZJ581 TaxID=3342118 RepID=UPI0035A98A24
MHPCLIFLSVLEDKHAASKAIGNLKNDLSRFSSTGKGRINQIENVLSEIE